MSVLPFRRRSSSTSVAVRLSDSLHDLSDTIRAARALPAWVGKAGYERVDFRRPRIGEYFYDAARDKVIRCAEDIEEHAFVVLEYKGAP